jgi:hypothetical protein
VTEIGRRQPFAQLCEAVLVDLDRDIADRRQEIGLLVGQPVKDRGG